MNLVIYTSPALDRNLLLPLRKQNVELAELSDAILKDESPKIIICDYSTLRKFQHLPANLKAVLFVGENEKSVEELKLTPATTVDFSDTLSPQKVANLIQLVSLKDQVHQIQAERDNYLKRLKELNNIGVALTNERNLLTLGEMILQKSREITSADAGSLYLVEADGESGKRLRFRISQNDSMDIDYEESVMPLTKQSIAGYVASTGESLNIPDVYHLSPHHEYNFNRHFDEHTGYKTTSTLAVPMKNRRGEVLGVIQLINRKNDFQAKVSQENFADVTRAFDNDDEDLVSSLASQAAVALENSRLIRDIETLFEGFVTASVTAIESRDPTTSGHSSRVANLTVGLAEIVDKTDSGQFREIKFSSDEIKEMRYAGLLHDFGKVGVRENVLVKAKKLYPLQLELIRERFNHYQRAWEAEYYKTKLNLLLSNGRETYETKKNSVDEIFKRRLNSLQDYFQFIEASNEPTVLPEGNFEKLQQIAEENDLIPPGLEHPVLSPQEVQLLSIRKGSLNEKERVEIESHVVHTYIFLSKIPWTSELKRIPEIAYGHHEKLNGTGYPNRSTAERIPIQTRMMTISDIYDALTASDRPYKKAVSQERALDILSSEVKSGHLDYDLFQIFLDAKVYLISARK
ncbi:MAG TPA: HD domain-containing phosphohydrolase [Acidobacteriota bacterium]|nr:HD domain-containing phosphohydrolase [Acidobacteriota bacterium]